MKDDSKYPDQNFIVQTGKVEPTEKELEEKRATLFKKLSGITPDQLKDFKIDPAFQIDPFDAKSLWQKTIWAK
jgi:hypothetical protein